ncbi:MAG: NAD-dependent epimerase/dehydratase family protein, partial [Rhodospirillales bacterium]|nr:NAD-dependent epimerase/dehydratase family protein [Rhodospirillales bacterium]
MAERSVLVTGANGLIGYALLQRLARTGISAVGTDLRMTDAAAVPVAPADLRDRDAVYALVERYRPHAIVHAGGVSGPMVA